MKRALACLVSALALLQVVSACGSGAAGPHRIPYEIASHPESKLIYPGARLLSSSFQSGYCRADQFTLPFQSSAGRWTADTIYRYISTTDAPEQVVRWYDRELAAAGWSSMPMGPENLLARYGDDEFIVDRSVGDENTRRYEQPGHAIFLISYAYYVHRGNCQA